MESNTGNLLLDKWNKIVDTFCLAIKENPRLIGGFTDTSRDEVFNYLSFYFLHGGLFVVEDNNEIVGLLTVHPQKSDLDWTWKEHNGDCTIHAMWAKNSQAVEDLIFHWLLKFKPVTAYACRDGKITELQPEKIERVIRYGKRKHNNTSTSAA